MRTPVLWVPNGEADTPAKQLGKRSKDHFPFMELPGEIRNEMYAYLFSKCFLHVLERNNLYRSLYFPSSNSNILPMVCRQVRREVIGIISQRSVLECREEPTLNITQIDRLFTIFGSTGINNLGRFVTSIGGLESFLARHDASSFCHIMRIVASFLNLKSFSVGMSFWLRIFIDNDYKSLLNAIHKPTLQVPEAAALVDAANALSQNGTKIPLDVGLLDESRYGHKVSLATRIWEKTEAVLPSNIDIAKQVDDGFAHRAGN